MGSSALLGRIHGCTQTPFSSMDGDRPLPWLEQRRTAAHGDVLTQSREGTRNQTAKLSQHHSPPERCVEHTTRSLAAGRGTRHEETKLQGEDAEEKEL
jgi:hypothetical protein